MPSHSATAPISRDVVRSRVRSLPRRLRPESADGLAARWELRIGSRSFCITVGGQTCTVADGPAHRPDSVIVTDDETWLDIDAGRLTGGEAFLARRLTAMGNLDLAVRLLTMFRPTGRARRPTDLDQVEVDVDGLRLSAYVVGRGNPILLLHGLGGTKITWTPFLTPLAEGHRLIVPDLPGHGGSAKPRSDYSPKFFARVLDRMLGEMAVDRAVVVGNSMGGRVAVELALRAPDRVARLALLSPAVPGFRWRLMMGFTRVFPTEVGAIPFPLRERWMEVAIRRLFADPKRLPPAGYTMAAGEFIRIYREPRARMAFFASLRQIVTERPDPFYASLRGIEQPTLVVFGDQDRLVPPRLGVRLVENLPDARLVVLPGVGHVPQFEVPETTLEVVREFMAPAEGRGSRR
jgi:pimeloyl-ACP methyl ester carboxylesterase/putative sterol carrier protein